MQDIDVPEDFPVQPIDPDDIPKSEERRYAICGTCGWAWDDETPTELTPTPSARCPFEYYHVDEPEDIWAMLEQPAPQGCDAVQDLYSWSLNYDPGKGPFVLFLDLIGWSEDQGFGDLYDYSNRSLGYVELSKLAAALEEYSCRPHDVSDYVDALETAEMSS